MAILPILHYPDNRLRKKAEPVTEFTTELQTFIDDMFETMYDDNGIGLAATQVNVHQRVIVMDIEGDKKNQHVFINPEILASSGTEKMQEGCLSVPGIYDDVERANSVKLRALNRKGETLELDADGLFAVCIQHEIDHLNGVLFIDHLSPLKRERAIKKMEKIRRQNL